jgi:hypothetical protein
VYRALDHGIAKNACKHGKIAKFPKDIQEFADNFIATQAERHLADYDPMERVYKSSVNNSIGIAENLIDRFEQVPLKDRRAFAAHVLFKSRPD